MVDLDEPLGPCVSWSKPHWRIIVRTLKARLRPGFTARWNRRNVTFLREPADESNIVVIALRQCIQVAGAEVRGRNFRCVENRSSDRDWSGELPDLLTKGSNVTGFGYPLQHALREGLGHFFIGEQSKECIVEVTFEPLHVNQAGSTVYRNHPGDRIATGALRISQLTGVTTRACDSDVHAICKGSGTVIDSKANRQPVGIELRLFRWDKAIVV